MTPERKEKISEHLVEEFWWAGKFVVYVDNVLVNEPFEQVINRLKSESSKRITIEE